MKPSLKIPVLILGVILTACFNQGNTPTDSTVYESKPENYPIEIVKKKDTNRPYNVIATISTAVAVDQSTTEAIEKLKMSARKMGGDALLDLHEQSVSGSAEFGIGSVRYRSRKVYLSAQVIVWQ
ncbi:MAG: hypothetical protein KJP23_18420 [Deltaproteobacteria bacterium]|nr:hypothetical protein [Deltaproteobacteria bacterium]